MLSTPARILLLERESWHRRRLRQVLQQQGYHVVAMGLNPLGQRTRQAGHDVLIISTEPAPPQRHLRSNLPGRLLPAAAAPGEQTHPPGPPNGAATRRQTTVAVALQPDLCPPELQRLVGSSEAMRKVRHRIVHMAAHTLPVLIQGESGTGKELAARALHACSVRAQRPFVAVNCSAIPNNLLEAELFGIRKGAFTGASQDRPGLFLAAHGGTLFLDEIGELPLTMQAKLLRAVQERRVRAVGATDEVPVNVRIISATHSDLAQAVETGLFRRDLYYRLHVLDLLLPPLRERREDLPELCQALLARLGQGAGQTPLTVTPELLQALHRHPLRGNVRELENLLHRAGACAADGDPPSDALRSAATDHDRPTTTTVATAAAEPLPDDLHAHLDAYEAGIIRRALVSHRFNQTAAAARLGLSLRQMRYRIHRLAIDLPR